MAINSSQDLTSIQMSLLICLAGAYELPDMAENIRGGISLWTNPLAGQRVFLNGQTFPTLTWNVYNLMNVIKRWKECCWEDDCDEHERRVWFPDWSD